MKVIRLIAICLLMAPATILSAQSSLTVEIVNIENNKGVVIVDIVDQNDESVTDQSAKIVDKKCTIVFKDLKKGTYAIRFFHDENSNEELDMNFLGIPKEGFGFSNDAIGKFGPKDFSEWLFEVSGDTKIKLKTYYMFKK